MNVPCLSFFGNEFKPFTHRNCMPNPTVEYCTTCSQSKVRPKFWPKVQKRYFHDRTFKQVSRRYQKLMERKNAPSKKKGGDKIIDYGGGDGDRKEKGSSGRSNAAKRQKRSSDINMEIVSDNDHEQEGYESEPDVSTICGLCRGKLTDPPRQFHDPMLSSLAQMPPNSLAIKQKYIVHKPCCSVAESGVALVQCSNAKSTMFTLSPDRGSKKRSTSPRQKMACPHPNYHLACSAIPVGSRLYRDAVTEHYIKMCGNSCDKSSNIGGVVVKEEDERKMAALSGLSAGDSNNNADIDNDVEEDDNQDQPQTHFEAEQVLRGYLCPYCDVEGTSHYLIEYFEAYRRSKTKFCKNQEAVDRVAPATELGRKFIEHVISKASTNHLKPGKGLPQGKSKILSPSKLMGIGNGGKIPAAAGTLPGLSKEELALQTMSEIQLPHIRRLLSGIVRGDDGSATSEDVPLDPTFFVGQPIKLYSPIEDAYHVGRIIDWRSVPSTTKSGGEGEDNKGSSKPHNGAGEDEPPKQKTRKPKDKQVKEANRNEASPKTTTSPSSASSGANKFDNAVGRTQYLVRFRAGIDGRKIPVHQWMFLEEHAVAVGVGLIWANTSGQTGDKVRASNEASDSTQKASNVKVPAKPRMHYRPAQIVVRSILEMLPVKKLNTLQERDDVFALAHYFHRDFHYAILKFDRAMPANAVAANGGSADSREDPLTMVAADFVRPPPNLQKAIREARIDDDASLVLSISMATMEREEERRARQFHKLPLFQE